jgi:hypothetical protein
VFESEGGWKGYVAIQRERGIRVNPDVVTAQRNCQKIKNIQAKSIL